MNRWLLAIALTCLLAACATPPSPVFDAAKVEVEALKSDATVKTHAPVAVTQAEEAIHRAEVAENLAEREHQATLASIQVQIARARSAQRQAEQSVEAAAKRIEELQMEAEVSAQRRQAEEADRREALLRAQAEAERRRAELEKQRAREIEADVADMQGQLAELKPSLTSRGLVLTLGEVLFDFDSASLKPYAQRIMQRLADYLLSNPGFVLRIEGHTDNGGDAETNLQLSASRAAAVAESLNARGIDRKRMRVQGLGEQRPIASNDTTEGRQKNRRVEVIVTEP